MLARLLVRYAVFISNNWLVILASAVLLIICLWVMGYYMNGMYGTKFELASCWIGIAALTAVTVIGFGKELLAHVTYYVDSRFNTNQGEKPADKGGDINV